ncbi:cytochrome P450 [Schizophyllum commune H4-8]|uniref:cytochrome P450 n=1 Tax=Schizophyllum commune (strain H4-8 / FGSC 9210) TaxID=578458 RepID=UPI00216028CD|nr:cytochrome P450 [Schizophyllum commune H4-8]KAI5891178.1 cytochrome P450 [Schizophyllum commune H4-8]
MDRLLLISIFLALFMHTVFRTYEPSAMTVVVTSTVFYLAVITHAVWREGCTLIPACLRASILNTAYLATLTLSIALYRLSPLHPLAAFPGPRHAAQTKWWMVHRILLKGGRHQELQSCHRRYGPWVRIGPNELSINDPAAIAPIYTKLDRSNFHKGAPAKGDTMITVTDRQRHLERRRTWTQALSARALETYGTYAQMRVFQLLNHMDLDRRAGRTPVNVDRWVNLFFMDLAGDIGFSGGFETMRDGYDKEGWMEMLGMGVRFVSSMGQVPWMRDIFQLFPQRGPIETFHAFVEAKVKQIREETAKTTRVDIMGTLLDDASGAASLSNDEAVADAGLIIVGATDTSVQTVLTTLRYLATDPYRQRKLHHEIDAVFGMDHRDKVSVDISELARLPYLNACINESFRILPPGPFGPPRTTGKEGALILGRWIPPNTTVHVPVYTMHRDPANFGPLADVFIPERWLSEAEQVEMISATKDPQLTLAALSPCNRQAFMPFSAGYANCVGRALGLQNVKLTVAAIVHHWTIAPESGFDAAKYDASFKEYGLWTHDTLRLDLIPRAAPRQVPDGHGP